MASALTRLVESRRFTASVTAAVLVNALILGVDTYGGLPQVVHDWCGRLDDMFVTLFVVELLLKLGAWRLRFFRSTWNLFDLIVVAVSLVAAGPFSVLRALRVLRTLRLVSVMPAMRRVVEALVRAVPGISAIIGVLMVFFYVGAVLTTNLFGPTHPELFDSLGTSTITLFQLMLFDNWADVIRATGETYWWAPFFFVAFTVLTAFAVLNLFIAVMVDALRAEHDRLERSEIDVLERVQKRTAREVDEVETAVKALGGKVDRIADRLDALGEALQARRQEERQ